MAADEMPAMARQISSTRPIGNAPRAPAPCFLLGRVRNAASPSTAASPITATNTPRQAPHSANTPPASGPTTIATLHIPESRAMTRGHVRSGKASRTTTYETAPSSPPPKPATRRPAMTPVIVGASAQTSEPRPKMKVPTQKVVRAPNEAVSRPVQVAATIDEARKAVVGQCIRAAPPSSPTIVGRTVASNSTFIEWSSMPPASTASGGSHSGLRSDCQPSIVCSPLVIQRDYGTSSALEVKRTSCDRTTRSGAGCARAWRALAPPARGSGS